MENANSNEEVAKLRAQILAMIADGEAMNDPFKITAGKAALANLDKVTGLLADATAEAVKAGVPLSRFYRNP